MKLLAFAASTSSTSINKKLAAHAAGLVANAAVEILDLNDYDMPLFSEDREKELGQELGQELGKELGQPAQAHAFLEKIASSDGVVISFAEHNGSYSAAYKNVFDWASRINPKVFQHKPMVLLATSPGPGGGSNVLAAAVNSAPHFHGSVVASMSVPSFGKNFDEDSQSLTDKDLNDKLSDAMAELKKAIEQTEGEGQ